MAASPRSRTRSAERCHLVLGGCTRSYLIVRGPRVPGRRPAVVVMLHGTLQTAATIRPFAGYGFDGYAEGGGAVVIYPDALRRDWNGARAVPMVSPATTSVDDVGFLTTLIERTVDGEHVDATRVYVVGFSLGGQMTIRLIHEAPELLAGAALIGATLPVADNRTIDRDARRSLPVLTVHGTADPLTPYSGGVVGYRGRFGKGLHLSAPDTARYFAARNGISDDPVTTPVLHRAGSGRALPVTRHDWTAPGAAPVRMFTVHRGGHVIPNPVHSPAPWFWGPMTHDISAPAAIAEFFDLDPEGVS